MCTCVCVQAEPSRLLNNFILKQKPHLYLGLENVNLSTFCWAKCVCGFERERACVCVGVFVCAPFGPIELNWIYYLCVWVSGLRELHLNRPWIILFMLFFFGGGFGILLAKMKVKLNWNVWELQSHENDACKLQIILNYCSTLTWNWSWLFI